MPRFYFDYMEGGIITPDPDGLVFQDLHAAAAEAERALCDFYQDMLSSCDHIELAVEVRDETGPIFRLILRFDKRFEVTYGSPSDRPSEA